MKKFFLMLATAMLTASVNAQNTTIASNQAGDNWYLGVNAGLATPMQKWGDNGFFKGFAPSLGVRVGKNLTTVFGLALDANAYFASSDKSLMNTRTFVDATNVDLMGTFNLSNLFGGYQGEPRNFEVIGLYGFGLTHFWGMNRTNLINSKAAIDFAFNFGSAKQYQFFVEPAVVFGLYDRGGRGLGTALDKSGSEWKYDSRNGLFQLNVGLNYKFGCSNGTHNYAKVALRDQAEIDQLNAKINELRADVNTKDGKIAADGRTIADLQSQLAACQAQPKQTAAVQVVEKKNVSLQPIVIFGQGKSTLDNAGYASCEMVAKYMKNHPNSKVLVKGYASPEGNAELNKKLSEARAAAVKTALVQRYKIAANRITTEGLGATSDISEENDFNRVAMFFDVTK